MGIVVRVGDAGIMDIATSGEKPPFAIDVGPVGAGVFHAMMDWLGGCNLPSHGFCGDR